VFDSEYQQGSDHKVRCPSCKEFTLRKLNRMADNTVESA